MCTNYEAKGMASKRLKNFDINVADALPIKVVLTTVKKGKKRTFAITNHWKNMDKLCIALQRC